MPKELDKEAVLRDNSLLWQANLDKARKIEVLERAVYKLTNLEKPKTYDWEENHNHNLLKANEHLSDQNSILFKANNDLHKEIDELKKDSKERSNSVKKKVRSFNSSLDFLTYIKENGKDMTDLKLIRTGGDTTPPTSNWLMDMKVGTVFSVRSKMDRSNFMVLTLEVLRKTTKTVRLWDAVQDKLFNDVDPTRFINFFDCIEA